MPSLARGGDLMERPARSTRWIARGSRPVALTCAALFAARTTHAQLVDTSIWAHEAGSSFGTAIATGDVNCDGRADLIVGTPDALVSEPSDGKVEIWFGDATLPPQPTGPADLTIVDETASLRAGFGASVAAGDLDHNGCDDLVVGSSDAFRGLFGNPDRAHVSVFFSTSGTLETASWTATGFGGTGALGGSRFGQSVATADIDGDGVSDLIVGEPDATAGENNEGAVLVWLGGLGFPLDPPGTAINADWTAQSNQAGAHLGTSVANADDVDADGDDEVLAGAPDWDGPGVVDEGSALLWMGSPAFASTADGTPANSGYRYERHSTSVTGAAGAHLGASVAGFGDVDADGYADFGFGAPDFDAIYVGIKNGLVIGVRGRAFGPVSGTFDVQQLGLFDQGRLGASVAPAGDVNGDGRADFLTGAPGAARAELTLGNPDWTTNPFGGMTYVIGAPTFASVVATAGDWNDDGFSDVVVGAPNPQTSVPIGTIGRVYVFAGSGETVSRSPATTSFGQTTLSPGQPLGGFGFGLAFAGDINHDGFSDVIAGAPLWESEAGQDQEGRIFPYYGGPCAPDCFPLGEILVPGQREGNEAGAHLGVSVDGAGDVNGDGYADVIAGAPDTTVNACTFPNFCFAAGAGRAHLYMGSASGLDFNAASIFGPLPQTNAHFGQSVSGAGDVNGDGFGDVIVGAPNAFGDRGQAHLYLGSATGLGTFPSRTLAGAHAGAHLGIAVAGAGDVNADGYSDVVIGADGHNGTGAAFVYLGRPTTAQFPQGLYPNPIVTYLGTPSSSFGSSVASAGDVNRDGFSDVIVGAMQTYLGGFFLDGEARVYHGGATLSATPNAILHGDPATLNDSRFGSGVSAAGDVDGDGYGDVIVGDQWHSNPDFARGKAYVFHGSATGIVTTGSTPLEDCPNGFCDFGRTVAGGHDVNGDGFSDVLVAAYRYDGDAGAAFVHLGNGGRGLGGDAPGIPRRPLQIDIFGGPARALLGAIVSWLQVDHDLRSPAGRTNVQIETELKPLGQDFDGLNTAKGPFNDNGVFGRSGVSSFIAPGDKVHWRARVRSASPIFGASRWVSLPGNAPRELDVRVVPEPAAALGIAAGAALLAAIGQRRRRPTERRSVRSEPAPQGAEGGSVPDRSRPRAGRSAMASWIGRLSLIATLVWIGSTSAQAITYARVGCLQVVSTGNGFADCLQRQTSGSAPGIEVQSSGEAHADLSTGVLRSRSSAAGERSATAPFEGVGSSGNSIAEFADTITIGGDYNGPVQITMDVSGVFRMNEPPYRSYGTGGANPRVSPQLFRRDPNSTAGYGASEAGVFVSQYSSQYLVYVDYASAVGDGTVWTNANSLGQFDDPADVRIVLTGTFVVTPMIRTFDFVARLGTNSSIGGPVGALGLSPGDSRVEEVDFGNSAHLSLIVPAGVPWTSESTVFLQGVPEPGTSALLLEGLLCLGVYSRSRRWALPRRLDAPSAATAELGSSTTRLPSSDVSRAAPCRPLPPPAASGA